MEKLAQEDHSYCLSSEEYERSRKNWFISLNKSGKNATDETPIRLPNSSHNHEPSPTENLEKNDQNQSLFINTGGGIHILLPVLHGGIGIKTGGAHFLL